MPVQVSISRPTQPLALKITFQGVSTGDSFMLILGLNLKSMLTAARLISRTKSTAFPPSPLDFRLDTSLEWERSSRTQQDQYA
jgi:hypothetical protein